MARRRQHQPSSRMDYPATVLVTGATGYIGGRLTPRLLAEGHRVRVLARSAARVRSRSWADRVEIVEGDALDRDTLARALAGVDCAYYLIHSMGSGAGFHALDVDAARLFGQVAREAGVRHIVYLGGLGDPRADLSQHLRSRQETGRALREGGVPVTEFRAAVIVGSGSISFEMIRYLVERLPVMVCPRWVYSRVQPIAVNDVLDYLVAALSNVACAGKIIEIGGREVTTYRGMMLGYARARGLRRWLVPVPVLTPRLSSYWVHWITPIPSGVSGPLIEGLRNEVVVTGSLAPELFPGIEPRTYAEAIAEVIDDLEQGRIETAWSDAHGAPVAPDSFSRVETHEGMIFERRTRTVAAPAGEVFRVFTGIGGARGWFHADWMWRLRGMVDRLLGGAGLRRGRRHPEELRVGDALDFWRVEALEPGRLVRLRAEMKLPGRAWLQFRTWETADGKTHLEQTAAFLPKGLGGLLYWYGLYPVHARIFDGMAREIARRAEGGR
ncbi:MAG: SDR family oxidoreductase [Deltaproteobacteria bacterium]|nr:SDR family oxidoreductase [Deltaproteobacteria bacterium]